MSWIRREDLEEQETQRLAAWATHSRDNRERRHREAQDPLRTVFQRDRDRIIHSTAFRRLQHKTQVFAAHEGDHFRSRMTHSLEVSQMARGAAIALRLNPDLAEAVALAHDLGHPPFGHVGEAALDELMQGEGGFAHNAHGLRIVDYLEDRQGHGHGLNLALATRLSLLKGGFPEGFPLSQDLLQKPEDMLLLEAQVVDLCDKMAYLCHDLDDALRAGLVEEGKVRELRLFVEARGRADSDLIASVLSEMIAALMHDLVEASDRELGPTAATWKVGKPRPRILHSLDMQEMSSELLTFLQERFYHSRRVLDAMEKGKGKIRSTFEHFLGRPEEIPAKVRAREERDGRRRLVCDYVAGMTDRFLLQQEP